MRMKFITLLFTICFIASLLSIAQARGERREFNLDETYKLAPDGTIHLTTYDAEVEIIGSDRKDVHLEIHHVCRTSGLFWKSDGGDFDVDVREEKGDLYIREYEVEAVYVGVLAHQSSEYHTVLLEVPQGASLRVRGDDDDFEISNIQGKITLQFEDGDARLENCLGGDYDFEFEDGCVEMDGGKGTLSAYIEDGELIIDEGAFTDIDAEVEDGDIEIATSLADDGSYDLECEDGDVELIILGGGGDFRIIYEDGHVKASSKFETIEDEDEFALYRLPGGDALVRLRTEDGRVRLSTE